MPLYPEGTFRLYANTSTGGVTFGGPENDIVVLSDGFSISDPPQRVQDTSDPFRDGILFGRDYYDGPTLSWSLAFKDDGGKVWSDIADFQTNWRDAVVLNNPGALTPLTFTLGGRTLRVWGRTRKFAVTPSTVSDNYFQTAEATFQVVRPEAEVWSESRKSFMQSVTLSGSGTTTTSVVVDSQVSSPLVITLSSSSAMPAGTTISASPSQGVPWSFTLAGSVGAGATLTIDTRTRTASVSGTPAPATLSRTSSLAQTMHPNGGAAQTIKLVSSVPVTANVSWTSLIPF